MESPFSLDSKKNSEPTLAIDPKPILEYLIYCPTMKVGKNQFVSGKRGRTFGIAMSFLFLDFSVVSESQAAGTAKESNITITFVLAQGVDHNLKEIPVEIITADVDWDNTHFSGLSLDRNFGSFASRFDELQENPFGQISQGVELVAVKHRGLQENVELGLAYKLNTPVWHIARVEGEAALGLGLSHAFSEPTYEDGPIDNPDELYRTQLLILFDTRWRLSAYPRYSILFRVHHRSGAYGLIAPRNVGSNFLTLGLGYDF
jgi:hypothetical protein